MQTIINQLSSIINDISMAGHSDPALNIIATHVSGLTSGSKNIDSLTGGFQRGEVIMIAAPPFMGMLSFAISLVNKVLQQELGVAYFSTFLSVDQLIKKLLTNHLAVSMNSLLKGDVSEVLETLDFYADKNLYIDDTSELTANIIEDKIDSLLKVPDYVLLDDLNLFEYHLNTSTTDKILKLKGIARKFNIPVVILYNTRDTSYEPALTQKQFIELQQQEVFFEINRRLIDTLCTIYRPEYFKIVEDEQGHMTLGRANFIIVKNDCGEGIATFKYKHEYSLFEEIK